LNWTVSSATPRDKIVRFAVQDWDKGVRAERSTVTTADTEQQQDSTYFAAHDEKIKDHKLCFVLVDRRDKQK
jgi:hypothetical protein